MRIHLVYCIIMKTVNRQTDRQTFVLAAGGDGDRTAHTSNITVLLTPTTSALVHEFTRWVRPAFVAAVGGTEGWNRQRFIYREGGRGGIAPLEFLQPEKVQNLVCSARCDKCATFSRLNAKARQSIFGYFLNGFFGVSE